MSSTKDIIARLAKPTKGRSEATIQADIRQLLLTAALNLEEDDLRDVELESAVGDGRRIDIEIGYTVIEVKRKLDEGKTLVSAKQQLLGVWI